MPEQAKTKKQKQKEYEQLGRTLAFIYETGFSDRKRMLKINFLRGIVLGVGSVIGATLVVAVLIWVVSLFDSIPLIGPFMEGLRGTIEESQQY